MKIKKVFIINPKYGNKKWHKLNIEEKESKPMSYYCILESPKEKSKLLQHIENNKDKIKYVNISFKNT